MSILKSNSLSEFKFGISFLKHHYHFTVESQLKITLMTLVEFEKAGNLCTLSSWSPTE